MFSYPTIHTERFKLREIEQADILDIYKGLSDPRVIKYYGVSFLTLDATQEQMNWYEDLRHNETGIWWGIYSLQTGGFCGAGGFNGLEKEHRKAEIGFWLLPEFWGKGIMSEVMPTLFKIGFEHFNLNRIEGFVQSENIKCKSALEKIHFEYEGTMRACEIKEGELIDVDIYAILNPALKPAPSTVR
jgi:[ribosomal protein S5]-alanine N-acetyltransferase